MLYVITILQLQLLEMTKVQFLITHISNAIVDTINSKISYHTQIFWMQIIYIKLLITNL